MLGEFGKAKLGELSMIFQSMAFQSFVNVSICHSLLLHYTVHEKAVVVHLDLKYVYPSIYSTTSRISLLLHKSEAEPRTSVNKLKISYKCRWSLTGFYPTFDVLTHL